MADEPPTPAPAPAPPQALSDADIDRIAAKVRLSDDDIAGLVKRSADGTIEALRAIGALTSDPPAVDPPAVDPPAIDPPAVDPPAIDPPAAVSIAKRLFGGKA